MELVRVWWSLLRVGLAVATASALWSEGCDPITGESTLEGSLSVATSESCSIEGDCAALLFRVSGEGFTQGINLKVFIPGNQAAGAPEVVFSSSAHVGGSGRFVDLEQRFECLVIPRPGDAPGALSLVADEVTTGLRRAFTFVDSGDVLCLPPFTRLTYTQPCGQDLCPTLTADSPSSIGMHWDNRDAGYDTFRIRYAPMDADFWTETREFGSDVGSVAVNNLVTGTTYEFELLACVTHFLAGSDCTGWQPVGVGAPG